MSTVHACSTNLMTKLSTKLTTTYTKQFQMFQGPFLNRRGASTMFSSPPVVSLKILLELSFQPLSTDVICQRSKNFVKPAPACIWPLSIYVAKYTRTGGCLHKSFCEFFESFPHSCGTLRKHMTNPHTQVVAHHCRVNQ